MAGWAFLGVEWSNKGRSRLSRDHGWGPQRGTDPTVSLDPHQAGRGGAGIHSGSDQPVPPVPWVPPTSHTRSAGRFWSLARLGLLAPIHLDAVPSPGSQLTRRTTPSIPRPSRGRLGNEKEGGFRPQEAEAPG